MKRILLCALVSLTAFTYLAQAQPCNFGNIGIKVNSEVPGPGNTCLVNFDMYFDIDHNAGGKYFWFHVWPTSQYTSYNYSSNKAPTLANGGLVNSVLTFGFNHFQSTLLPMSNYLPDPSAPGFQANYTILEIGGVTFDRYTARGLRLTLPQDCNIAQPLVVDAWQTQAENGNNIHCFASNTPFILNDPTITGGLLFCQIPRTYRFDIKTTSITTREVNFKVIIDNGDGLFNQAMDTLMINSGTQSISNSSPYHSPILGYAPYSSTKPYCDHSLWVVVLHNATDIPNDIYAEISNTCTPLPVTIASFSAQREKDRVQLAWTTSSENNNKGFYIERKEGTNGWQTLGFVYSKAAMGNSATDLSYDYSDLNLSIGLSQYRLRQVDIDERMLYSEIRLVRGLTQNFNMAVFPNPSKDGEILLVMDKADQSASIKLIDMNGHVVRQWNHIMGNRLQISAVSTGIYVLQVWIDGEKDPRLLKVMVSR